jgi:hypothetical protein
MAKKRKTVRVAIPQGEGHYDLVEVRCKARRAVHDGTPPCICEPKKSKKPKTPRPPWPLGPSVIPPPIPSTILPFANPDTGAAWEHTHETTGSNHCNACIVDDSAPRVGGLPWADFVQDLISKLGFQPRYPGLSDEAHLRELIGPRWAEDAKKKWVVNWTVDGYLERRPHLKATKAELRRQHTCVKDISSINCRACNRGVPYPHESLDELLGRRDTGDGVGAEHPASPRWSVYVDKRGVHFAIDHQSFTLRENYDPDDGWTKEAYYKWWAKQLTIAFKWLMDEP